MTLLRTGETTRILPNQPHTLHSLYDLYDKHIEAQNQKKYRPFPILPPETRRYHPSDVSLVVPTVDADPSTFAACLRTWARCQPKEIIVVTTAGEQEARVREMLMAVQTADRIDDKTKPGSLVVTAKVELLTVDRPNKRHQLVRGIRAAKGEILALVDDDARWESEETLASLLAPFEEEDVGVVGGPIDSYLPPERRDPSVVTPWEVAALRLRANRHARMRAAYAADGGINFCVSGATMLARAAILRDDPLFRFEFVNEHWAGRRQNSGDDTFITRWCLFHHLLDHKARRREMVAQLKKDAAACHGAGYQALAARHPDDGAGHRAHVPQAGLRVRGADEEVVTEWYAISYLPYPVKSGSLTRRDAGLRLRLTCLLFEPGIVKMYQTTPYMARKMVECMLLPFLHWLYIGCWFICLMQAPLLGLGILLYELYNWANSMFGFVGRFPYAAPYWWAAALIEKAQLLSDFYCWATLGTENWETRNTDGDQESNPLLLVDEIVHGKRD
ncbi:glycosyltransferase family 2 [Apiospora hydei]|uniref:Glycosyltransferase family 2 n=1 Tax=Apiospora hydei TaxID=1337664 RepID=A0ABR1WQG3_9PEZI